MKTYTKNLAIRGMILRCCIIYTLSCCFASIGSLLIENILCITLTSSFQKHTNFISTLDKICMSFLFLFLFPFILLHIHLFGIGTLGKLMTKAFFSAPFLFEIYCNDVQFFLKGHHYFHPASAFLQVINHVTFLSTTTIVWK